VSDQRPLDYAASGVDIDRSDDVKHRIRAVVYGSAMGSFAVERFSVQRLLEITSADIAARVADFRRLVAFEEERPA